MSIDRAPPVRSRVPDAFADRRKILTVSEESEALDKEAKDGAGVWAQPYSSQAQVFLCYIRIPLIHGRKSKLLSALAARVIALGRYGGGDIGQDRKPSYYYCSREGIIY